MNTSESRSRADDTAARGLSSEQVLSLILPASVARGYGGHLVDSDGRDYVDMVSAWGANLLGYGYPRVAQAIARQAASYTNLGLAGPEYLRLHQLLLRHIPCAEAIHLVKNGSDATAAAVRLARHATGRVKVLQRGYHGAQDWYMAVNRVPGVPATHHEQVVPVVTLTPEAVAAALAAHPGEIACLILDPLAWPIPSATVMAEIQSLLARAGALLIFDEVVSGFRVAVGGMQAVWGVTPDLACYGKGIANGAPLAVLAGHERWMRDIPAINYSLTFGFEALSIVSAIETLGEVVEQDVCTGLAAKGRHLKTAYAKLCAAHGVHSALVGHDCRPHLEFEATAHDGAELLHYLAIQELARQRVCTYGTFSLCHTHTDADLAAVLAALDAALARIAALRGGR